MAAASGACTWRCHDRSEIGLILACDGVHGFEYRELYDRRVSCLGEWVLAVRDRCVYRDRVPVQDDIGFCDGSSRTELAINMHSPRDRFFVARHISFSLCFLRFFTGFRSVVSGILRRTEAVVHSGACVAALWFVSR